VFLLNGVDPLCAGNLTGLRDHVQALGFTQTYYGQLYHAGWCERQMERIHQEDPEGRFVLIGYGAGARTLYNLGQKMAAAGLPIDVLLALDGPQLEALEGSFPVWALGSPCEEHTVFPVAEALAECASRVTVVETVPSLPEPGPTPRPVVPLKPQSFGPDWDSLKPVARLP
jgi:thioesterase domain-containing protein